ncbi:hypothetical protein ACHAXH_002375 [Discostella pseudostelligera]
MKVAVSFIFFAAICIDVAHSQEVIIAKRGIRRLTNLFADVAVDVEAAANVTNLTSAAAGDSDDAEVAGMASDLVTDTMPNPTAVGDPVNAEAVDITTDLLVADDSSNVGAATDNIFASSDAVAIGASSDSNMLDNQIICGYQGWFAFPGDGAPINKWRHWFHDAAATTAAPLAGNLTTDVYPTIDEYDDADMRTPGILMKDGSFAKFFSSARPNVVLKHFEWMQTYGISGVFSLRFMQDLHLPANREWKTMVLRNIRKAAESTGRIFAVSYNIAGTTDAILEDLKADWIKLVDDENITQSSQYIRQNGLPILRIYGIGFNAVNVTDTTKMAALIKWFQTDADEKYRAFLIGGVPSKWRELKDDSRNGSAWKNIYDSLDGIHPWHVGRWNSISSFDTYHTNTILNDAAYCESKGILYMPTMWPGFSWHNLKKQQEPINAIPRLGGTFMWRQAYKYAAATNINTVWLAQFDECDEGTAIFKLTAKTSDLPANGKWLALDADGYNVPSDHYLRLAGEAQKMLEGSIPIQDTIPTSSPTRIPTQQPTSTPTQSPTRMSTQQPTSKAPTGKPTSTKSPSLKPTTTNAPTLKTITLTKSPTLKPITPTKSPTLKPTTPSKSPTLKPITPTKSPTLKPITPTKSPTLKPITPTKSPTLKPITTPTKSPTSKPITPTKSPTLKPTSKSPTLKPTKLTTDRPTPTI